MTRLASLTLECSRSNDHMGCLKPRMLYPGTVVPGARRGSFEPGSRRGIGTSTLNRSPRLGDPASTLRSLSSACHRIHLVIFPELHRMADSRPHHLARKLDSRPC